MLLLGACLTLFLCLVDMPARAQNTKRVNSKSATAENDSLPYVKYPALPAFNIRLMDSATVFNTYNIPAGRPIIIVSFSPDCKHCKLLTKKLMAGMDSLNDADFYFVTPLHNMAAIRNYYSENHFENYKNIKAVGRDDEFFFHDFYRTKMIPSLVVYDERKKLIKLFDGKATVQELYNCLHSGKVAPNEK
jgi:hypothetical protein